MSDDDRYRDCRHRNEGRVASVDGRTPPPRSEPGDVYGPFQPPGDSSPEFVYEEFSCEDALLATVFDTDRSNRWIQTTVVVPVEE